MKYIIKNDNNELMHYGVMGMKWGVRKSVYKSMNKQQRKEIRKKYYNTPEGKIKKATTIGTVLAGPLGGVIAGSIASKKSDQFRKMFWIKVSNALKNIKTPRSNSAIKLKNY